MPLYSTSSTLPPSLTKVIDDDLDGNGEGPPDIPPYQPPAPPGNPGDECESCRQFFESNGEPPRHLILLPDKFTDYGIPIVVCPFCDGEPILLANGLDKDGSPVT